MGPKVYSLLFIGVASSTYIGMAETSLILPLWGWTAVFNTFGFLTLTSLTLLFIFEEQGKLNPYPFSHYRPFFELKKGPSSVRSFRS